VARYGLAADEIAGWQEEKETGVIVMGMRGAGIIEEKLIGSVTTSLLKRVKCPVLVIDQTIRFRPVKSIVLACDYKELNTDSTLEPLKEFARLFHAQIMVLNVVREPAELMPTTEQAVVGVKLEHSLEDVEHSFHYTENSDVVDGINEYVKHNNIDMVAMVPHAHSVFHKVFQEPFTKRMAFHTPVPLLVLNERS
jgi:nucleotide-binding universal stress UspA family protein